MSCILVVDDEPPVVKFLTTMLKRDGYQVVAAQGGPAALELLKRQPVDLMVTDHKMEPMDGLELMKLAQKQVPSLAVILISGYGTVDKAVEAMRAGAFDYLTKPVKVDEMRAAVHRALEFHDKLSRQEEYRQEPDSKHVLGEIVAVSPAMQQVCEMIKRVAPTDTPVLILGERGTDKYLVARTIHDLSPRKNRPCTMVECSLRPEARLKAWLLGDSSGTSTTASVLEQSSGGTLLLFEVGSLPMALQERLSRLLLDKPGSTAKAASGLDIRVLASSQDPLHEMVEKGTFREDLYRRLGVITIKVPPLRERREDILPLVFRLLQKKMPAGAAIPTLTPEVEIILNHYAWPGNLDELQQVIGESVPQLMDGKFTREALPPKLTNAVNLKDIEQQKQARMEEYRGLALKAFLRGKEKEYLQSVMNYVKDDKDEAARRLNIAPEALDRSLTDSPE